MTRLPRFRLATLLLVLVPLGLLFLYARHRWEGRPIHWGRWSVDAVKTQLESGRVVVVHFTANWDATSAYNFHLLSSSRKLAQFSRQHNTALMVADWTEPSNEILEALEAVNTRSIPTTVIHIPGEKRPIVIRDMATDEEIISQILSSSHSSPTSR